MISAATAAIKWATRASQASADFVSGAQSTTKDQSISAIAAKDIWLQGVQEAAGKDRFAKGLQKSGKQGWLTGITEKGRSNYSTGVSSAGAKSAYSTESARFDTARGAAESMPRGPKGSPQNLARVTAVANALHAVAIA